MIVTKEQQEALVERYIKEGHGLEKAIGFIDGLKAMLDLIEKLEL